MGTQVADFSHVPVTATARAPTMLAGGERGVRPAAAGRGEPRQRVIGEGEERKSAARKTRRGAHNGPTKHARAVQTGPWGWDCGVAKGNDRTGVRVRRKGRERQPASEQ